MGDTQSTDQARRDDSRQPSLLSAPDASMPPLSSLFDGRYRIDAEIGNGGTSVVYRAYDERDDRYVAVKVLRPDLTETTAAHRFESEIRRHQSLSHRHIVPVLDFGESARLRYCVLPLMTGGSLRDRLQQERQLDVADAVAITRALARAIGYAHTRGVIHRDVKPENILFEGGIPHLADFGIARDVELSDGVASTTTGIVRGTGPYMSPEQAVGEKVVDGRTDVYSLGCVLYEMLTGMQPFVGPTAQAVIAQRMLHEPRPMTVYRPGLSPSLAAVVERAMQITPSDRFPSANAMADALEGNFDRVPARVTAATPLGTESSPWSLVAAATAGLVLVTTFLFFKSPTPRPLVTREPTSEAGTLADDARRVAVLYLDNQSPEQLPTWVSDGLTEELMDRLASVPGLRVISPNGVRQFRGRPIAPDSLGRLLDVGTVISGSVARAGDAVRVSIRLTDAPTNQLLYALPVSTLWTSVFALQDSIADRVTFALRQRLGTEIALRENRRETSSLAAWELLQQAIDLVRSTEDVARRPRAEEVPGRFLRADSLLARAERLDRGWLRPRIRRGRVALALSFRSPSPPPGVDGARYAAMSTTQQRIAWGERALAIANELAAQQPDAPEVLALRGDAAYQLAVLGSVHADSMVAIATRDLRLVVEKRPGMASAWSTLADLAKRDGRFAEAADAAERAFDADAFFEVRRTASTAFFMSLRAGRIDKARQWCQFGLSHYRGDPRFTECELTLLGWTGRTRAEAESAWQLLQRIEKQDTLGVLALTWNYRRLMYSAVLARASLTDSARAVLRVVQGRQQSDSTIHPVLLAEGYVQLLLGDRAGALNTLEAHVERLPTERAEIAALEWFRPLRDEARFSALVGPAVAPSADVRAVRIVR